MKRIIAMALAFMMAFTLAACDENDAAKQSDNDDITSNSSRLSNSSEQTDQPSTTSDNSEDSEESSDSTSYAGTDESYFVDTDWKGVADNGDHYQICYHNGNTIVGLEDWYTIEEGASAQEMISMLEEIHAEDSCVAAIYRYESYVIVAYLAKDYYTNETWDDVKELYD